MTARFNVEWAGILSLSAAALLSTCADTVVLKNGRSIEGLVTSETSSQVVLDLGVGSMTIARDRIAGIKRSDAKGQEVIRRGWEERHFLHKKYIPKGWEDIAEAVRGVLNRRDQAVAAQQLLAESDKTEASLRDQVWQFQTALLEASRKLMAASPQTNIAEYNGLVAESNAAKTRLALLYDEIEKLPQQRKEARQAVSDYLASLATVEASVNKRAASDEKQAREETTTRFLGRITGRLKELDRDFAAVNIQATVEGGNTLVSATVNGQWRGRFVVDTGATLMTLSEDFARRAGFDLNKLQTGSATVADGKKVPARLVILDSVQVGDAKAQSVPAAILSQSINRSVDGLLGMSFLRNFDVRFNGTTGELVLTQFNPR